jgi:PST family polysaccharide transporter
LKATLKNQTINAIGWTSGGRVLKQFFQLAVSVILTRLLTPEDFGLIGMTLVFMGFAGLFDELGLGAAIIQRKEVEERHLSSTFWANACVGLLLMILLAAVSPAIASFFNEPRLRLLVMLLSLNLFIGSLNVVQNAILNRDLDFRRLVTLDISATMLASVCAVFLAYAGYGVYALVWQLILLNVFNVAFVWATSKWKPSFIFDKAAIKELWGFSSNLLGFTILNYWIRTGDNLLIGKFAGPASLGIYTRAYSLMLMPISQVTSNLSGVMFPALSRIQDDKLRIKRIYLQASSVIALITFPMMLGLFVAADVFVLTLFGAKWIDVIPVIRILCFVGLTQSIGTTVGWLYYSQGRTDLMFKWGIWAGIVTLISFAIGIFWGAIGVATAYAVRSFLLVYFNYSIPGKLIDMSFSEVAKAVSSVLVCAVLMASGIFCLRFLIPASTPVWLSLMVQVTVGVVVYVFLIATFKIEPFRYVRDLIKERWNVLRTRPVLAVSDSV